jgi:hypothetical protein
MDDEPQLPAPIPDGFEPTDDPHIYVYNPLGFEPSDEQRATIESAIRNARELDALPAAERMQPSQPEKYSLPIGILTPEEEARIRERRGAE